MLVEFYEGSGEIAFNVGLDGFCENCVRIVVVENHDVLGATDGGVREATSLVAENLAGDGHRFVKHTTDSDVGIERDGRYRHEV